MRKIIVSEFVSLDGVMEDPGGAEKTRQGGWAFQFERGPEGDKFKLDEVMESDAMLLGRITYQGFAEAWPSRTGDFADKMNNMQKYVVSSSMQKQIGKIRRSSPRMSSKKFPGLKPTLGDRSWWQAAADWWIR